jgi:hypothetical protein
MREGMRLELEGGAIGVVDRRAFGPRATERVKVKEGL